jgi:hypothetical protein
MGRAGRDDPPSPRTAREVPYTPSNTRSCNSGPRYVGGQKVTNTAVCVSCKYVHLNIGANETYKPKTMDGLYYNHKHGEFLCQIIDCQLLRKITKRRHLYYVGSFCYTRHILYTQAERHGLVAHPTLFSGFRNLVSQSDKGVP